jgi:uncharacterized protein
MRVPYTQLSPEVLRVVIVEFVTRDGTDHSEMEPRIDSVLAQLESGGIELHYDHETTSCQFIAANTSR